MKTTPFSVKDFPIRPHLKKKKPNLKWDKDEPKKEQRIKLYTKCPSCILVPPTEKEDPLDYKNYKFPICTKLNKSKGKCEYNCTGILAANRRARLTKKYPKVVDLTSQLLNKWKCTKKAEKEYQKKRKTTDVKILNKPKKQIVSSKKIKPKKQIVSSKKNVNKTIKKTVSKKPVK